MRILVTTMHRTADNQQSHGYLMEIDWIRKQIVRKIEAPPLWTHFNKRNRGGRRGLRGITSYKGLIWVASVDMLFGLNPDNLELERMISHPYMAHIHDILGTNDGIWVTTTGGDGAFLINENQQIVEEVWLCETPDHDMRVNLDSTEKYHINSIFSHNDSIYIYGAKTGEVFKIFPHRIEKICQLERACHNVEKTSYGWLRSLSKLSLLRLEDDEVAIPRKGTDGEFTSPGWLRGRTWISDTNVLIGSTPATLYEIDVTQMKIVDQFKLESDVCWTVAGIFHLNSTYR